MSDPASPTENSNVLEAPAGLIDGVCDVLSLGEGEKRAASHNRLQVIASTYLLGKYCETYYARPKAQRAALRKLQRSIERTLSDSLEIAPEYLVALDHDLNLAAGVKPVLEIAREALVKLHEAILIFDGRYHPPKGSPVDTILEEAVRDLDRLMEELTGERPRPKMNKHMDCRPELESGAARALGMLLKGIDPALNDITIANMIQKVRAQPTPSMSNLDVLISLNPDAALDASLLSSRRGTKGTRF